MGNSIATPVKPNGSILSNPNSNTNTHPNSFTSAPCIFGGLDKDKMEFLDGVMNYEGDWEDICISMITETHNGYTNYTIQTIPVITEKIAKAAVENDKLGIVKKFLLENWKDRCYFLNEHEEYSLFEGQYDDR